MAGSRAVSDREPGQVRKEAALSGPAHAPRTSLAGAEGRRARPKTSFDDGCTVRFFAMARSRPRTGRAPAGRALERGEIEPYLEPCSPRRSSSSAARAGRRRAATRVCEAMRTFAADFRAVWEDVELEIDELFPGDEEAVAGACHWVTRGRASGVEGRLDFSIGIWARDGLIVRGQFFDELADARRGRPGSPEPDRAAASSGSPDALALPPPPPQDLRRGGGPGERRAHPAQRDRARQGPPRLPVRGLARHRQDEHGQAAGLRAQRRGGPRTDFSPDDPACQAIMAGTSLDVVEMDAASNNSVDDIRELQGERGARADGRRTARLHPRRGAHAVHGRVERVPQDPRGAAPPRGVRAGHDRGPQGARHDRRPLPPLRLPAPFARAHRRRAASGSPTRRTSRSPTRPWA